MSPEKDFSEFAAFYRLPVLSVRSACYHLMAAGENSTFAWYQVFLNSPDDMFGEVAGRRRGLEFQYTSDYSPMIWKSNQTTKKSSVFCKQVQQLNSFSPKQSLLIKAVLCVDSHSGSSSSLQNFQNSWLKFWEPEIPWFQADLCVTTRLGARFEVLQKREKMLGARQRSLKGTTT